MKRLLSFMILPLLLLLSTATQAQDKTLTGRVADSLGNGLAGVTITVKGGATATQSTANGNFTIKVPASATQLVATSVGYAPQEVNIDGNNLTILMRAGTATALNEVVVVGYGTQRKRDVTGAVASISSKDFVKGALQSPEQLIAGKVAGVQINTNSGAPGAGSRIRIRGGASLNASNDPLVVIDGVPVDNGTVPGSANALNLINPNDIENFTILKDPSAAAIYGSRASNGVILITTKKGSRGKVRYNATAQLFVQTVPKTVDVLSANQIRSIVATKGSAVARLAGTANTNWQNEIYSTALGQDFNLGAAGALFNGNLPFRISGGYLNQDGILRTGNFQRQTVSLNLSPKLFKEKLKVDINVKGARTSNRFADEGAIGGAISFDPTQSVKVNSPRFGGFFTYVDSGSTGLAPRDQTPINPVSLLEMKEDKSEVLRSIGNIALDYSIPFIKGLRANLNLGYDVQRGTGTVVVSDSAPADYRSRLNIVNGRIINYGGRNNQYKSTRTNLLSEFYLNYTSDLKSINSRIELLAGTGFQNFDFKTYNYADYRYDRSKIANSDPQFATSPSGYALLSYYGRLNYTLANRYVLTASLRTDGSSRFNKDERWGLFPSVAVAWRINEEAFLKNVSAISDLKLRVGTGTTGQQDGIDFYGYLPRYTLSNNLATYQLGNTFYNMYRPTAYDPNLKWETTTNLNAAIDYGLFRNRITGSFEFFYRKTKDLLSVVPIALGTNFSNQLLTNVGNIESRGVEFSIQGSVIKNKSLTWDVGFNVTYTNPKITKLLLNPDPSFKGNLVGGITGGTGNTIQIQAVGYRPNSFYVRKQIYGQDGKPIEGLYEDLNRDGVANESERYVFKSPDAKVFMGINSNVYYGKWNAGFVARVSLGNYNYNNLQSNTGVYRSIVNPLGYLGNANVNYLQTNFQNNQFFSDYYVQNASFLRMDNINVGYDLGQVAGKATVRLTANVQNAFIITKYKGLDPEVNTGIDNQIYPRPRTFVIGANINF